MGEPAKIQPLHQNNTWVNPGDFPRFREFLIKQAGLHPEKASTLAKAMPTKLYAAGTLVGIDEAQMAKTIALFLSLPYAPHVNPAELQLDVLPSSVTRSIGNSWTPSSGAGHRCRKYD
jgi:hypothetical protein